MQPTLVYIFFLTTCGLARATSLPDPADNILLDVKKLPSAEENPVPNPEDDDISANVEDLQRELMAERAKNRDLNQTISDILEEMEDMKKNIMRNEEKITDNESSVFLLSRDVDDLQEDVVENSANITKVFKDVAAVQEDVSAVQGDIAAVQEDVEENSALITNVIDDVVSLTSSDQQQTMQIESLTSSDQQQTMQIETLASQIDMLGARSHWCGYQGSWGTVGTITYDYIFYSDSNMNITGTPLDINTGIFTVPVSGAWRLSYNMESRVPGGPGEWNTAYLYLNDQQLPETDHYSQSGAVSSTGGRVVTLEASAGDEIEIRTTSMDGSYGQILYCAEFIPKM